MDIGGKTVVWLQVAVVTGLIVIGTWQLFLGNFAAGMSTFPLLVLFWMFLTLGRRR